MAEIISAVIVVVALYACALYVAFWLSEKHFGGKEK